MPIQYPAEARTILLCDYSMGGFREPEMVKRRPAIVLVGRLPRRNNLLTVVPLSGTASHPDYDYQCQITLAQPLPHPFPGQSVWWVKADMVSTVCFEGLDLFRTERDQSGKRKYLNPKVSDEQFAQIQATVRAALRLPG